MADQFDQRLQAAAQAGWAVGQLGFEAFGAAVRVDRGRHGLVVVEYPAPRQVAFACRLLAPDQDSPQLGLRRRRPAPRTAESELWLRVAGVGMDVGGQAQAVLAMPVGEAALAQARVQ